MKFIATNVLGAYVIELDPTSDSRGSFSRTYCAKEFSLHGLPTTFAQCNLSRTLLKGTVRGLHYQKAPSAETKLVRCNAGSVWDVIVDLRKDSPTFLQHFSIELSAENGRQLFVPAQVAHGYQTLGDGVEVFYQMGDFYAPDLSHGVRPDDPRLRIKWPLPVTAIADKDREWPLL